MIELSNLPHYVSVPLGFLIGLLLGYGYFCALRKTTIVIVTTGNPLMALALTFSRLAMLVAILYATALIGGPALVAALFGIIFSKAWMLRGVGGNDTDHDFSDDEDL